MKRFVNSDDRPEKNKRNRSGQDSSGGWGSSNQDYGGWGDTNESHGDREKSNQKGWGGDNSAGDNWGSSGPQSSNQDHGGWGDTNESRGDRENSYQKRWGGDREKSNQKGWGGDNSAGDNWGSSGPQTNNGQLGQETDRPPAFKPEEIDLNEEAKLQEGAGENFHRYKDQTVTCFPPDKIKPIDKFEDLIESELLLTNIKSQKFTEMTPIQKWAVPAIVEGYDLIGCAQTGSGKTAAFLLPVFQTLLKTPLEPNDPNEDCKHPYCLIISPTRELANQIHIHANILAKDSYIKTLVLYGGVSTAHQKSKLSLGCHLLVATPGKLKDFVNRGWLGFKNIKYVILDEGDRLVDEGFSTDTKTIFEHPTMPPRENRQTLFFSATFQEKTQLSAKEYLRDEFIFLTVGRIGSANEDIKQEIIQVTRTEKKRELKKILMSIPEEDKTIIFTQTKQLADTLAGFFNVLNLSSTSIHGDRHQSQREEAIRMFRRGLKRFLISSPVGNRGLDLPKVSLVINYDMPKEIDEYVHRIGRTGRAGHSGKAISFFDPDYDSAIAPDLMKILQEAKQEVPSFLSSDGGDHSADFQASGIMEADDWGENTGQANPTAPEDDDWGCGGNTSKTTTVTNQEQKENQDHDKSQPEAHVEVDDWGNAAPTTEETETKTDDFNDGW